MANTLGNLEAIFERRQAEAANSIPKEETPQRAFISAPTTVDTSLLREALRKRGFTPYELDEVQAEGRTIPELLEDCVQRADLVVAVVGGGASENVLFELGYAVALKKRILALVPPGEEMPPSLAALPYLRTGPNNREAIEFGLDRILSVPASWNRVRDETWRKTKPIGPLADELLKKLAQASKTLNEEELTDIVSEALAASSISSVSYSTIKIEDGRVDFAIWSDDFEPWLGNPLFVEVRSHFTNPAEMNQSLEWISGFLTRGETTWALLLYGGAAFTPEDEAKRHPRVFVVTIERFLESLRDISLGVWLSQLRNMRVHGRG